MHIYSKQKHFVYSKINSTSNESASLNFIHFNIIFRKMQSQVPHTYFNFKFISEHFCFRYYCLSLKKKYREMLNNKQNILFFVKCHWFILFIVNWLQEQNKVSKSVWKLKIDEMECKFYKFFFIPSWIFNENIGSK